LPNIKFSDDFSAVELDEKKLAKCIAHGKNKCDRCAAMATNQIRIYPAFSDEVWQNKIMEWQEICDDLMRTHFPQHSGTNCSNCPEFPIKPTKPYERL